jgi:hypothetical protein
MIHGIDPQQKHKTNGGGEPEQQETASEKKVEDTAFRNSSISQILCMVKQRLDKCSPRRRMTCVQLKKMSMGMQCM